MSSLPFRSGALQTEWQSNTCSKRTGVMLLLNAVCVVVVDVVVVVVVLVVLACLTYLVFLSCSSFVDEVRFGF